MTEENLINDPLVRKEVRNMFVLTGGGCRGAWQFEALMELIKAGYEPYSVCGASTGTLGCFLYMFDLIEEGRAVYREAFSTNAAPICSPGIAKIKNGKLKVDWFKLATKAVFAPKSIKYLMDNAPLKETITKLLPKGKRPKCDFFFNVSSMQSGRLIQFIWDDFDSDDQRISAMAASAAIPVVFPLSNDVRGISTSYNFLGDGGVLEGAPLGRMYKSLELEHDYRIFVLGCNKREDVEDTDLDNIIKILGRTAGMFMTESLNNDLDRALDVNELAKEFGEKIGRKYTPIHYIQYSGNRGIFEFTPESLEDQIATAKKDVQNYLTSAGQDI